MARTFRVDKYTNKRVPDGKHPYRCKCGYCTNVTKNKQLIKIEDKEQIIHEIDSSSDSMNFFYPEKQAYLDKHYNGQF